MDKELRREIILHALRWTCNILVEILSSHAHAVNPTGAGKLRQAVNLLQECQQDFRK